MLVRPRALFQGLAAAVVAPLLLVAGYSAGGHQTPAPPGLQPAPQLPEAAPNPAAEAVSADEMRAYTETIAGTAVSFDMVPLPAGSYLRGSPGDEAGRSEHEGPQGEIVVEPVWMAQLEVSWDQYRLFMLQLDLERDRPDIPQDALADAVSRPTPPYVPMDFGMGTDGFPAISMTQFAARHFTKWLSMRTGRFYRLPTEAEWEYACRAGTRSAFGFEDAAALGDHAWYRDNSESRYHRGGQLQPNAWGLFDMHGNVAEWTLDALEPYRTDGRLEAAEPVWPETLYPRSVRGGSFGDSAEKLRCAARRGSSAAWKARDPQIPQSIWYHTSARFVGFRVVRPLTPPPESLWHLYWEPDDEEVAEILEEQRLLGL